MDLSSELISQFAKITNDNKKEKTESTVYGTTVILDGRTYVKLDGSDRLTPVETTTAVAEDERVMITIKDHTATITGNISSPAAKDNEVKELGNKIDEFDTIVADKVKAETAEIETAIITKLDGKYATFESLDATYASIKSLEAAEADIDDLQADNVEINNKLTARVAEIDQLKANSLTVEVADAKYASIDDLEATNGKFNNLESTYGDFVDLTTDKFEAIDATIAELDVESLNAKYANIDFSNIGKAAMENFYANSGLIENVVVGDQTITGELVGVTIRGDRIIGGSIVADKLVIKGNDGIYYKLNAEGGATPDQLATEEYQNGLHGSNIIANSITAEKIKVDDLVAFDATIGNFNIGDNSIYSGAKASVDNTTRGIYMDTDGQLNFGDSNNFLKFYKDQNGSYKLDISASSLRFGATGQSVEEVITDIQSTNSSSGSSIVLTDSSDGNLIDLKIYGKTTQNGTPTPDAPVPLISVGDSGSFELGVYGKNLFNSTEKNFESSGWQGVGIFAFKKGVKYTVSLKANQNFTGYMPCIVIWANNSNVNQKTNYGRTTKETSILVVEYDKDTQGYIYIQSANGGDTSKHTVGGSFMAQIELGEHATPYKPYIEKQTLTMPYNLLRIPALVDYNYIDENGQTYIRDEIDLHKGIFDSRIIKTILNGSETYTLNTNGVIKGVLSGVKGNWTKYLALSTHFTYDATIVNTNAKAGYFAIDGGGGIHFTTEFTTIEEFKTWLQSNNVIIYAVRTTPIETPLTEEELEAYAALHTNNPNTTIFADGSPELYVEYFRNTRDGQALANNTASIQISSDRISSKVTDNAQSITGVKTDIEQLSDQISTLVQDGSGQSLMVQSGDGWVFSMGEFEDALNNLLSHVKIGTYNDQPCLELTVDDSKQRLMLTNTDIRFMENDTTAAYITGDVMNIDNARIDNKFSIDGYEWSLDSDDTLNLLYT